MPILVLLIIGVHTANVTDELLNDDSSPLVGPPLSLMFAELTVAASRPRRADPSRLLFLQQRITICVS